jgi:hypothetical protein
MKSFQIEIYSLNREKKDTELYEINIMEDLRTALIKYDVIEKTALIHEHNLEVLMGALIFSAIERLKYILIKWI